MNCVNIKKELETVTNKYPNVFSEKLGTIKGAQAKVNVIPNSKPKFMKARTVPFAMKAVVDLEIERMENEIILKFVASPGGPERPTFRLTASNDFLRSYRSTPHTITLFTPAQLFIGRNISTKIDLIKSSRLIVKKKSHDENEICLFSSKYNVIVRFFDGKEHWENGKIWKNSVVKCI